MLKIIQASDTSSVVFTYDDTTAAARQVSAVFTTERCKLQQGGQLHHPADSAVSQLSKRKSAGDIAAYTQEVQKEYAHP
jgi:hypothetical protein